MVEHRVVEWLQWSGLTTAVWIVAMLIMECLVVVLVAVELVLDDPTLLNERILLATNMNNFFHRIIVGLALPACTGRARSRNRCCRFSIRYIAI